MYFFFQKNIQFVSYCRWLFQFLPWSFKISFRSCLIISQQKIDHFTTLCACCTILIPLQPRLNRLTFYCLVMCTYQRKQQSWTWPTGHDPTQYSTSFLQTGQKHKNVLLWHCLVLRSKAWIMYRLDSACASRLAYHCCVSPSPNLLAEFQMGHGLSLKNTTI